MKNIKATIEKENAIFLKDVDVIISEFKSHNNLDSWSGLFEMPIDMKTEPDDQFKSWENYDFTLVLSYAKCQ